MNLIQKKILIFSIIILIFLSSFFSATANTNLNQIDGFEKGIGYLPIKPIEKVTFVKFDKESIIDDLAYLSCIPSSVFKKDNTIFSSPLLFHQPDGTYPKEDKFRFLNDYMGTEYLMEDFMGYCNNELDKLITINVDEKDLDPTWEAKDKKVISSKDPFELASQIAETDWSYSDEAVVAVVDDEYQKITNVKFQAEVHGNIEGDVENEQFVIKRPYGPAPEYEHFNIGEEFKYVKAYLWYPAFVKPFKLINLVPGFRKCVGITIPSVDPDFQIFCKYEDDWLQTAASSEMALIQGPYEECYSYVYEPGEWRVGVTNMPTEGGPIELANLSFVKQIKGLLGNPKLYVFGSFINALKSTLFGVNEFNVDITKYPGIEIEIPDSPIFGCKEANFKLTWENDDVNLGLTLLGPTGEEIDSIHELNSDSQELNIKNLGHCLEEEKYKVVVYALDDIQNPIDFTVSYSWKQNYTKKQGDFIASATEGAVLGSILNAPLLYVKPDKLHSCTIDTLYKLGVNKIFLVDLGGHLNKDIKDELDYIVGIKEHFVDYFDVYDSIKEQTNSNDIVFSTIDPWSWWYYDESANNLKSSGEFDEAFYFAPAAYAAAHHGTPVLLIENHPELSSASTWHIDFWNKNADGYTLPSIACMFLTGSKVQQFLKDIGFDTEGIEDVLTIAGQYDLGPSWTRVFAGIYHPGAIIGTPIDATNHICRNIFYPGLIFENPALKDKVDLETGSVSERVYPDYRLLHFRPFQRLWARLSPLSPGLSNLKITQPSRVEEFEYPVLHTYGCYNHRFNERGYNYWGSYYHTRTGRIPGKEISSLEIDEGTRLLHEDKVGAFLPDMSTSEITPFYAEKAGYSNCYSTDYDITLENLNKGVISWYMVLHGVSDKAGILAWWVPVKEILETYFNYSDTSAQTLGWLAGLPTGSNPIEENPWRGYDMLWGSTKEPDSATLQSEIGLLAGFSGLVKPDGVTNGGLLKTGLDIVPTSIGFPENLPFIGNLINQRDNYYDGLVGPYSLTAMIFKFYYIHPAKELDDKLENLHSMSFYATSCLVGCNYFQILFMRHGSVLQELDPWPTSYWSGYASQQIPKELALGYDSGEIYTNGIMEVGVKYLFEDGEKREWWWDTAENMVLFSDPNLRVWIPSTEWDEKEMNHWDLDDFKSLKFDSEISFDGHMPFGTEKYPNMKQPKTFFTEYFIVILAIFAIIILLIIMIILNRD